MRRFRIAGLIVVILLLAGGSYAGYLHVIAGEWKTIEPHFAGVCRKVAGVPGAEDITIHPNGRVAFISADDRRAHQRGETKVGAIYSYRLDLPEAEPVHLTPAAPPDFHPHGISLFISEGRADRLFAVNHRAGGMADEAGIDGPPHSIEVFDFVGERLDHVESLTDPLLISPNDIVAIGSNEFYVTNDHGTRGELLRLLEDYLLLPLSFVVRYDGSGFRKAAGGIAFANGINANRAGDRVYVASTTARKLFVYDRDAATGRLENRREILTGTGVDNIEVDRAGALWIAAHPKLLTFVEHTKDPETPAPSQVLKVTLGGTSGFSTEEVFLSDGTDLSGSSVAARHGDRLLIGTVMDGHFLDCRLEP
ncbi:MAG: SMP-30/gluconolactonase/LRE family protein [Minwuiales bacterium]|nr:SMP-30/gluconolactonase/LRE family protein [Minwuiales bacterium]